MRRLVPGLILVLAGVGGMAWSSVAHGWQDAPTIAVYKSPT